MVKIDAQQQHLFTAKSETKKWVTRMTHGATEIRVTHVCVELPDEAGEVVVLEVLGQQVPREVRRVPHHEAGAAGAPRHDVVGRRVLHHLVGLDEERRRRARPASATAVRVGTLHAGRRPSTSCVSPSLSPTN